MKSINWNEVKAASSGSLPAGGYVCGITSVEDMPEKEYLRFEYDIAEGEYINYFRALEESKGFWGGSFIKSYKQKALSFFKAMIEAFEKSNSGFKFTNDEKVFRRKLIGLVLSEEEYQKDDGTVGQRRYVSDIKSVDDIRKGNFKVKPLKTLAGDSKAVTAHANDVVEIVDDDDDDLPFG